MEIDCIEPGARNIDATRAVSRKYAWIVFALTFGLLLSDYMSRQVLNAVFPLLKQAWGLSDTRGAADGNATPHTVLTDIRPAIEIALQLEALHGDPLED